jgi:two-component system, sensor histidine kinase
MRNTALNADQGIAQDKVVLLIDDNTAGAQTMAMLLSMDGYTVHVARSGKEGLSYFEQLRPSTVLLDIGLPDMSGYEVARAIRKLEEKGCHTFLIATTGWGDTDDVKSAKDAGCDMHLTKPVDVERLEEILEKH